MRYLHEQDYKLKVPRPWPLHQYDEQHEAFCEKLRTWQQDERTDVCFCDQNGFEGDPRPRRPWTKIGKVRVWPYLGEHICDSVFGAVRPADGHLCSMLFNLCDSETFQVFLDTLAQQNPPVEGCRAILVLKNASSGITSSRNTCRHARPTSTPLRGCCCA